MLHRPGSSASSGASSGAKPDGAGLQLLTNRQEVLNTSITIAIPLRSIILTAASPAPSTHPPKRSSMSQGRSEGAKGGTSDFLGDPPPDPRFLASLGALSWVAKPQLVSQL
jgi:hypothetical protein